MEVLVHTHLKHISSIAQYISSIHYGQWLKFWFTLSQTTIHQKCTLAELFHMANVESFSYNDYLIDPRQR